MTEIKLKWFKCHMIISIVVTFSLVILKSYWMDLLQKSVHILDNKHCFVWSLSG